MRPALFAGLLSKTAPISELTGIPIPKFERRSFGSSPISQSLTSIFVSFKAPFESSLNFISPDSPSLLYNAI
jgi:hypothetical protein